MISARPYEQKYLPNNRANNIMTKLPGYSWKEYAKWSVLWEINLVGVSHLYYMWWLPPQFSLHCTSDFIPWDMCLKKRQTLPTQCLDVCANRLLCLKGFSLSNSITQIFAQGLGDSKSGSFIGNLKLMRGQITWPNRYGQKLFILHQLQQTFKNEFQFKRLFTQYDVIFCTILYLNFKHILKSAFEI